MDFADDRREEILEYTKRKYGKTMSPKSALSATIDGQRLGQRHHPRLGANPMNSATEFPNDTAWLQGFPMTIDQAL